MIFRIIRDFHRFFNDILFLQITQSVIVLSLTMLQLTLVSIVSQFIFIFATGKQTKNNGNFFAQLSPGSIEFWSKIAYMNSIFFQMSIFCYLGNEITFAVSDKLISLLAHQILSSFLFHGSSVYGSIDECVSE